MKTYLGPLSNGRSNNFDFLRFFFASLVILSHSYAVLYGQRPTGYDPLIRGSHSQIGFGSLAVDGFFLISGFLITSSWIHCKTTLDYTIRRFLRIAPALAVVLFVCAFLFGPLATTEGFSYFQDPRTYRWLLMMFTKNLHITDQLPGVFQRNPVGPRVNGSLWTIRVEVICYILVAVLGLIGLYRQRALILVFTALGVIGVGLGHDTHGLGGFRDSLRLCVVFMVGMTYYLYRDRIVHSLILFAGSVIVLLIAATLHGLNYVMPPLAGYIVFYVAYCKQIRLQNFARHGDFSYGVYLYAFPIQQLLVQFYRPHMGVLLLTVTAFVLTLLCAIASWYIVEGPCMRLKKRLERSPVGSRGEAAPKQTPANTSIMLK